MENEDKAKYENILIEVKNEIEKEKVEVKKTTKIKENETEIHLKGLAKSLGYKLVKLDGDFEEDSEIGLLKDLAAYKKGAILSELYYTILLYSLQKNSKNLYRLLNLLFHYFRINDRM